MRVSSQVLATPLLGFWPPFRPSGKNASRLAEGQHLRGDPHQAAETPVFGVRLRWGHRIPGLALPQAYGRLASQMG